MSKRGSPEAKAKEAGTRAALGPRLGRSRSGGHRITAPTKTPRATGAASGALSMPYEAPNDP